MVAPPPPPLAVCTPDFMLVVPRSHEACGPCSCNAVAYAGSLFVRSAEELEYARVRGPLHILTATGYPW